MTLVLLKVSLPIELLCIYHKSGLQSSSTLYIPKKGITEWLYSVYTKKVDYRVAPLCIYQKSGLQSSSTLYLPKKGITEYLYSVYTNKNQALLLCDPELSLKVSNER